MASGRSLLLLLLTVLLLLLVIDRGGPSHSASVSATTPGPFDLDEDKGLRAAVDAVGSELVLLTTNAGGVTSAVNMALQLRRVGLTAVLLRSKAPVFRVEAYNTATVAPEPAYPLICSALQDADARPFWWRRRWRRIMWCRR